MRLAHQMALENANIVGNMVEATEFMEWSQEQNVRGVPKTVVNNSVSFEGAVPEKVFLQHVLKAAGNKITI